MIDFQSLPSLEPLCIIIGAGLQRWPGGIPTQKEELELLKPKEWAVIFRSLRLDHRNQGGNIESISLIVDARKPL